ncbi:MAG: zinc-ribbon domain-containing protein, partial [Rhodococcus sp. (in: high G+C Gram-positive bacteria)]
MRDFICRKCGQKLSFENSLCLSCSSALGFHLPSRA